jgi:predicted MFS family arabinose efflux permease
VLIRPRERRRADPRPKRDERDFRRLWAGDAVSQIGSQITLFALPYTAVAVLHASGGQVGVLQALYTLPFLLVPLFAGVWLENRTRRPVLIVMNLICSVLVFSVPVARVFGDLGLEQLYLIAVLGGTATLISDIAKTSLVPQLVAADRLAWANSRLNAGLAVGATSGPGLAGWLTALVGAPNALIADGLSYVWCVVAVWHMRYREPAPVRRPARNLRKEAQDGLRAVFGTPVVRNIALHAALNNGGVELASVALVVYFVRVMAYGSAAYGLVLMCGGVGAVAGTVAAPLLIRRLGHGHAMLGALAVSVNAFWILPAAHGSRTVVVVLFALAMAVACAGTGIGGVVAMTVQQLLTPAELYSRMNASYRLVTFGPVPVGALLGGLLVQRFGAHATLWIAPLILTAGVLPIALRPVRTLGKVLEAPQSHGETLKAET